MASTRVDTPDPRQENPPIGMRLLIGWKFPASLYEQKLKMITKVRFWDESQKLIEDPILSKRGSRAYFFPNQKILTYQVQVKNEQNELVDVWTHPFWVEFIEID